MFETSLSSDWYPTCAVFDCDGVLLDSESTWLTAQAELFERYGATFTQADEDALMGAAALDFARVLAANTTPHGASADDAAAHEKHIIEVVLKVEENMIERGMERIPGALDTIKKLSKVMPVAVASNSSADLLTRKMQAFGFAPYLTTWVGADDVASPKPAPDMYAEAIKRLGGDSQQTLTVEDSVTGARAAQESGANTLIFTGHGDTGAPGQGRFDSYTDPDFLATLNRWVKAARKA
ncbi:HAD family phosphatase [Rothia sp. ZJ1223]|uniref:HAD family hydrolase n=1 Tax=Rothia sp. ZJ1223 TaxID=2811098 RepID=UPI00195715C8|nr:HAD family phosphatase [Rothia sp. ZJ1223]MBM7052056.1 HAD family phosphatase [Rothia sp. ZJ1223]